MKSKARLYSIISLAVGSFFWPLAVWAKAPTLDERATSLTVTWLTAVAIWSALLVLASLVNKEPSERFKKWVFWAIAMPVIFVSFFVAVSTVYLNVISDTKGPVHWHADFRIFNCGEEVDLLDPEGLSNKIGTPLFHEHDDERVHVEGTVHDLHSVSLGSFFTTIGGKASRARLELPTNDGLIELKSGEQCAGDNEEYAGRIADLQVFLYKTTGSEIHQEKLLDWTSYVLSPYQNVPPGDCLIFEFSPEVKDQTDKICEFYRIGLEKGEYGAANFDFVKSNQ